MQTFVTPEEKLKKELRDYSLIFTVFAIGNFLFCYLEFLRGSFDVGKIAFAKGISENTAFWLVIVSIALEVIAIAAKSVMAIIGFSQVKDKYKKRAHITIAKVFFIYNIFMIILSIYNILKLVSGLTSLISPLISMIFIGYYIKTADSLYKVKSKKA